MTQRIRAWLFGVRPASNPDSPTYNPCGSGEVAFISLSLMFLLCEAGYVLALSN